VLKPGTLDAAFTVYWDEVQRCRDAKAYWSLLHVITCLPAICAALETTSGDTKGADGKLYSAWCDRYLQQPKLSGLECYTLRCKLLHQGRAKAGAGRYKNGFAFVQPGPKGQVDHLRVENQTKLVLDVSCFATEMQHAARRWMNALESDPGTPAAVNAATS
jgi:hypothetical protein